MSGVSRAFALAVSICAATMAADLAVTRVALYKHGVAFYERAGEIAADEPVRLEFKASEMDDVLKSLTLVQEGGAGIAAVRYDSADPVEKRLEAFSFHVGSKASLADILDQFKGTRIAVRSGVDSVAGVIVSARSYESGQGVERQELLLATEAGELRSVDPREAQSIRFTDEEMQVEFREYLGVVAESRNAERRSLILESSGGATRVQAAYLAPAAIWKSSYRLILREKGNPLLEGAYDIRKPVTIPAGQSAMLPFYSGEVEARRLLIYSEEHGSQHPLNAAEIHNETGGALDGGAITVYNQGGYAGEAIMDTLESGDKRLVSYAVDLGVRITSRFHSESTPLRELHARDGLLMTRTLYQNRKTFLIRNVSAEGKTLWIEHEPEDEYEPVNVQPVERTANALRFEVALEPDSTQEFVLIEERTGESSIELSILSEDALRLYVQNDQFDQQGRTKLAALVSRMAELHALENEAERLENELEGVSEEQGRIRGNIETLSAIAGQQQRVQEMAETLARNESRIKELQDRVRAAEKRAEDLEEQVASEMQALAF